MHTEICGEELILLPQRAVYWPKTKTLWLADPHFGKATHFNKTGIFVPSAVIDGDLLILGGLLNTFDVERLIFMGDLFHSSYNSEWERFGAWLGLQNLKEVHLVMGNHDILHKKYYTQYNLILHTDHYIDGSFAYVHEYVEGMEGTLAGKYIISGHVHPGVAMAGKGRQGLRLPCFYFSATHAILPAFGRFTGLFCIKKKLDTDNFYVIANTEILKV
jgi:DNA ligase-associated metallophosphoesterase